MPGRLAPFPFGAPLGQKAGLYWLPLLAESPSWLWRTVRWALLMEEASTRQMARAGTTEPSREREALMRHRPTSIPTGLEGSACGHLPLRGA